MPRLKKVIQYCKECAAAGTLRDGDRVYTCEACRGLGKWEILAEED